MKKVICTLVLMCVMTMSSFAQYRISNVGKNFIKQVESCVLTAYWDSNGYSIGYGHHSKDVTKGQKITQAQANKLFDTDITKVEKSVNRLIEALPYKYKFTQGFIDGFTSFVYNVGEGGAQKSVFYNRLKSCRVKNGKMNEQDLQYALAGIKISNIRCKAHRIRRQGEYELMIG